MRLTTWSEIVRLHFVRKTSIPDSAKTIWHSNWYNLGGTIKLVLAFISAETVKRSAVEPGDLKPCSKGDSNKIYRMILFSCRPIHLIGNTWITGVKGKDIEKIHLYMYEVSSSQRFRTVNVIQIWPDASEESRAILSFLAILGLHYLFGNIFAVEIFANVENFGQIRENLSRETRKFYYFQKFIH